MSSAPTATSWPQLPPQYQDTPTRPESPSYTQTNRFNAPSAECSSAECSSAECSLGIGIENPTPSTDLRSHSRQLDVQTSD